MMSEYDKKRLAEILAGEGSWFNARLLRALDGLLPYADEDNSDILLAAYPEQCAALYRHYNQPSPKEV